VSSAGYQSLVLAGPVLDAAPRSGARSESCLLPSTELVIHHYKRLLTKIVICTLAGECLFTLPSCCTSMIIRFLNFF